MLICSAALAENSEWQKFLGNETLFPNLNEELHAVAIRDFLVSTVIFISPKTEVKNSSKSRKFEVTYRAKSWKL